MDLQTITEILAPTLEVVGHTMIALVVLSVHSHVAKEHKIDKEVITYMRKEQILAVIGIILVIAGYVVEITV